MPRNSSGASNKTCQNSLSTVRFHCLDPQEYLSGAKGMPPRPFHASLPSTCSASTNTLKSRLFGLKIIGPSELFFEPRGIICAAMTSLLRGAFGEVAALRVRSVLAGPLGEGKQEIGRDQKVQSEGKAHTVKVYLQKKSGSVVNIAETPQLLPRVHIFGPRQMIQSQELSSRIRFLTFY